MSKKELLRQIPAIELLLGEVGHDSRFAGLSHAVKVELLRQATDSARKDLRAEGGDAMTPGSRRKKSWRRRPLNAPIASLSLRKVRNATGVVLHTNLGRAPLSERAIRAVQAVAEGYSTLEYDLASGSRGERYSHVGALAGKADRRRGGGGRQ